MKKEKSFGAFFRSGGGVYFSLPEVDLKNNVEDLVGLLHKGDVRPLPFPSLLTRATIKRNMEVLEIFESG